MTNRMEYQRMKPGESKRCLAAVASRAATHDRSGKKTAEAKAKAKAGTK